MDNDREFEQEECSAEVVEQARQVIEAARGWFDASFQVWKTTSAPTGETSEKHVRREVARSIAIAEYHKAELRLFEAVAVLDGRAEFQPDEECDE